MHPSDRPDPPLFNVDLAPLPRVPRVPRVPPRRRRGASAGTDDALAAHRDLVRGDARLNREQARQVIEDAWPALDHPPVQVVAGAPH